MKTTSTTAELPTYPPNGQVFELTLDGDAPENQPLEMVRSDGFVKPEKWKFNGKKVEGKQTRRFRLVSVSYCRTWAWLESKLNAHGEFPAGQWREALKARYKYDGKSPIGVPDPSWTDPYGDRRFPCLVSRFDWCDNQFSGDWRWLMLVPE